MEDNSVINYPGSDFKLTGFESVMVDAASLFIYLAKRKITAKNKIDTGALSDLQITSVSNEGNKYSLTIGYPDNSKAWDYYDFQNKGVIGLRSGRPNSVYSFKSMGVSPKMVSAIMDWYNRHRTFTLREDQKRNLTGLQRKRKNIASTVSKAKKLESLAVATARNIKKKGIPRIGFIDDNIEIAFNDAFISKLELALGTDILLKFKQDFNGYKHK
jgi:hypothetical protein